MKDIRPSIDPSLVAAPQEKLQRVGSKTASLIIGVPKEVRTNENRVSLTPGSVGVLVANGHQVLIEHNAGTEAGFTDREYSEKGAVIVYSPEEIFGRCEILVKIAPLKEQELNLLKHGQTLISAVHLGGLKPDHVKVLLDKQITAIGFEFLQSTSGSLPIVRIISELAGITAIQIAAGLLSKHRGGKGLLLGGVTGVPPSVVTIIGAGTVGLHAAQTALGLGAMVKVLDEDVSKLKRLEDTLGQKLFTAVSQQDYVADAVKSADVVIGAAFQKGARTPCIVTEHMVASMREGSVIVDVSIDQGGCVETSRLTTHEKPTFVEHGVIHYCVPNISARVSHTASIAISNVLGPLLLRIGELGGVKSAIAHHQGFRSGVYAYHRHLTKQAVGRIVAMDYMDIDLLCAVEF